MCEISLKLVLFGVVVVLVVVNDVVVLLLISETYLKSLVKIGSVNKILLLMLLLLLL